MDELKKIYEVIADDPWMMQFAVLMQAAEATSPRLDVQLGLLEALARADSRATNVAMVASMGLIIEATSKAVEGAGYEADDAPPDVINDMRRRMRALAEALGGCATLLGELIDSGILSDEDRRRVDQAVGMATRAIVEAEVRRGEG